MLGWVMDVGSGFQPSAELLLVQLLHARDWSRTRGLQDRQGRHWDSPFTHLVLPVGGRGPACRALLILQSQAKGRDVLHTLTLCISSAGCRVPRSSVLSVTPSRLLETFDASTYEGPSRRAGPSYSAQLITPRGRRTTTTKKRRFKI